MLISVKGTFEEGHITFSEPPPEEGKQEVIVTFLGTSKDENSEPKFRKGGTWKGKIWMAPDFNEPLDDLKEYM
jgi:hypothetical protein